MNSLMNRVNKHWRAVQVTLTSRGIPPTEALEAAKAAAAYAHHNADLNTEFLNALRDAESAAEAAEAQRKADEKANRVAAGGGRK
jgi:hypothetical protein